MIVKRRMLLFRSPCAKIVYVSGCGAAWLARLLGVQEVPGSNPGSPTIFLIELQPPEHANLSIMMSDRQAFYGGPQWQMTGRFATSFA